MHIHLFKMRKFGVEIPKRALFDRYNLPEAGELQISEQMDIALRRTVRIAQFNKLNSLTYEPVMYLFEPHIIWMQADRFVLAGFERVKGPEGVIDYAQSWLCMTGKPPPVAEEKR
jgi:hypothetical protein